MSAVKGSPLLVSERLSYEAQKNFHVYPFNVGEKLYKGLSLFLITKNSYINYISLISI